MATSKAQVDVVVNGIQQLNNLESKLGSVTKSFDSLKTAIGSLAIGSVVSSLLNFADNLQDLSDATGIATQNLLGFQKAVQAFGGDADAADKAVLRLVTNIGAAADGSAEIQAAFGKVGVSIKDLATLSEQDILAKTIEGLGKITDKSEQAYLKQQLLGKEFRNVATSGLAEAYAKSTSESEKYAESIKAAAETQQKLEEAIGKVKLVLLEILAPAAEFVNSFDQEELLKTVENITKIGVALGGLWAALKVIDLIKAAVIGLIELAGAAGLVAVQFTAIGRIATLVAAALGAVAAGVKYAFDYDIINETAKALGFVNDETKKISKPTFLDPAEVENENKRLLARVPALNANAESTRKVKDANEALRNSLDGTIENFSKLNKQSIDAIDLQGRLIGLGQQETEVRKAEADIAKKAADEIAKLEDQKKKLNDAQKQQGGVALIDQTIAKIREQAQVDTEATISAIKNREQLINANKLVEFSRTSLIEVEKQIRSVQDEIATSTMSAMEKKAYSLVRAAEERATAEIKAEEIRRGSLMTDEEKKKYMDAALQKSKELLGVEKQLYDKSRSFSTGWANAFRDYADNATNAAKQAEQIFSRFTKGLEDAIVNFVKTGKFEWKQFVSDMLETLLRSQIQQTLAGIMGSFGDGSGGGLGGLLGGLFGGGGAGAASGKTPNNPLFVYDVASGGGPGGLPEGAQGQQGGGIMSMISNGLGKAWEGIKSVGSSVMSGMSAMGSTIWDGISSIGSSISSGLGSVVDTVGGWFSGGGGGGGDGGSLLGDIASGIGDFFGGWFANGGTLGAGKWGIAGENGPELISGPANISPLGGGTNVTYNINAVDAQSFKSMIAQDPSFIYAVSMQGAKGLPGVR